MDIINFIRSNNAYFEDFITRSTYHSNGIEGSTLSYAETYAILFNDNSLKITASPREIYEAINHKYALSYVLDHVEEPLSERFIKDIATLINKNISDICDYRKIQVFIQGAEHIPPSAAEAAQKMMYFVYNANSMSNENIFEKLAIMHIDFERIHPFEDGNGRTGRLLINYELLKNGLPPIVIPLEKRTEYFKYLAEGNYSAMSNFLKDLSAVEKERIAAFGFCSEDAEELEL